MFTEHIDFDVLNDPAVMELLDLMPALRLESAQFQYVPRRGWLIRNHPEECDLNGEHTTKLIWSVRLLPAKKLGVNVNRAVKQAFGHDLPEKEFFDITIFDPEYPYKKALETQWCRQLVERLGPNGHIFWELWNSYNEKKTPEACLVGQLDKIDCLVHAKEKERKGINIDDFIGNIGQAMVDPLPQWLNFYVNNYKGNKEPYEMYKGLLQSYDKFELSHYKYLQSDAGEFFSYPKYLERFENPNRSPQSGLKTGLDIPLSAYRKIAAYSAL